MVLGGPIDWDLGSLVLPVLTVFAIFLAAVLTLLVTAAVLLTVVTLVLTHLRRARPEDDDEWSDAEA